MMIFPPPPPSVLAVLAVLEVGRKQVVGGFVLVLGVRIGHDGNAAESGQEHIDGGVVVVVAAPKAEAVIHAVFAIELRGAADIYVGGIRVRNSLGDGNDCGRCRRVLSRKTSPSCGVGLCLCCALGGHGFLLLTLLFSVGSETRVSEERQEGAPPLEVG